MQAETVVPDATSGTSRRGDKPRQAAGPLSTLQLVIIGSILFVALAVVTASLRMTERSIERAVAQREAAARFLAEELRALRMMAMSAESPVAARLYLGIEECFQKTVAVPFADGDAASHRYILSTCAEMELGRLHAQGGAAMAEKGRSILKELALAR